MVYISILNQQRKKENVNSINKQNLQFWVNIVTQYVGTHTLAHKYICGEYLPQSLVVTDSQENVRTISSVLTPFFLSFPSPILALCYSTKITVCYFWLYSKFEGQDLASIL